MKQCPHSLGEHKWYGCFYLLFVPIVRQCRQCGAKRVF